MPLSRFEFPGAIAVVTGAASGMGEQLSHQLARKGCQVVLVDRDAPGLERVQAEITRHTATAQVHGEVVDLADAEAVSGLVTRLVAELPRVDLLINNAGIGLAGSFAELTAAEFDHLMAINLHAPIALCRGLLPLLRRRPGSHVVNVSSVFGIIGPPGQTAYATSKFALRGFSESLHHELAPQGIGVTSIHPGGIRTNIARTAVIAAAADATSVREAVTSFDSHLTYPADRAATRILAGVEGRRARVLIGATAVVPDLLVRLSPERHGQIIRGLLRLRRSTRTLPAAAVADTTSN